MTRVKRGYIARRRRNGVAAITRGSKRALSRLARSIQQQAIKTLVYSYRDRNRRKRTFRHVWIVRMNASTRQQGIHYNQLIHRFYKAHVTLNRKMMSQVALFDCCTWSTILLNTNKIC